MRHELTAHGKITSGSRSDSRTPTTSQMQLSVTTVNGWKPLTIVTINSILDTTPVRHSVQKHLLAKTS